MLFRTNKIQAYASHWNCCKAVCFSRACFSKSSFWKKPGMTKLRFHELVASPEHVLWSNMLYLVACMVGFEQTLSSWNFRQILVFSYPSWKKTTLAFFPRGVSLRYRWGFFHTVSALRGQGRKGATEAGEKTEAKAMFSKHRKHQKRAKDDRPVGCKYWQQIPWWRIGSLPNHETFDLCFWWR